MNWITRLYLVMGVVMLGLAARDEGRGVATVTGPTRMGFLNPNRATRAEDPKRFRELMTYEWVAASIYTLAGLVMLGICRRIDRLDPLDPEFRGTDALDDLDRTLDKEERQRRRPIK